MPRKGRVVAIGMPHHVTQRGNDRRDVFFHHRDRSVYLNALFEHAERYGVEIWGYCLMTNHVHLIAVPESDTSLARTLGRTHADYARYANAVRRGCGHLWQARFYSCPMERVHCWQALSYVEQNPVRAGLAVKAAEYPYSSARAHVDEIYPEDVDRTPSLQMGEWRKSYSPQEWAGVLEANLSDEALARRLKEATSKGIPFGSPAFTRYIEELLGRDLSNRGPGRPKKKAPGTSALTGK